MYKMNNREKVIKKLFEKPTYYFHLRELARDIKIHPNTLMIILDSLKKDKIVIKVKKKHLVEIRLNLENPKVIQERKVNNLGQIYSSGLVDYLKHEYSPDAIVLIGSYSRGEDIEDSDIDLVIFSVNKRHKDLRKFEKRLNRKIHILLPSKRDVTPEFFNNLINGIVLWGVIRNDAF